MMMGTPSVEEWYEQLGLPPLLKLDEMLDSRAVSPAILRSLAGNGWHLPSVGSAIMYILAHVEKNDAVYGSLTNILMIKPVPILG